ncbi:MAG: alpha/beta hydrolase [Candidatus Sulfotelmatobacter sp.]
MTTQAVVPRLRGRRKRALVWMACIVALLYLAVIVVFHYYLEPKLIFAAPTNYPQRTPAGLSLAFEDLYIPVDASTQIHAWWIPAGKQPDKVILYFHGNAEVLESEVGTPTAEAPLLHQTGANLLLVDYRGYGGASPIQASGPRTAEDAPAAMSYLVEHRHFSPSDIYIAGWSIGSGVATQLAVDSPHSAGLILLSPISSIYDVANQDLIYRTVLRPGQWIDNSNNFENKNKIASVHIPVLIVSGTLDTIASPWMPKLLHDRANQPKAFAHAGRRGAQRFVGQRKRNAGWLYQGFCFRRFPRECWSVGGPGLARGFIVAGDAAGLAVHEAVRAEANIEHGLAEATILVALALVFRLLALGATVFGGAGSSGHRGNLAPKSETGNVPLVTPSALH